jgi:type II secretory pathway pseudopilin PulG
MVINMSFFKGILQNEKGLTLLELTISILVGSIVITSLMSLLIMSVNAKVDLEITDRMKTESYLLNEQLQSDIFELQSQAYTFSVMLVSDTDTATTIRFTRESTIENNGGIPTPETTNPVSMDLVYTKGDGTISFDGNQLHSDSVIFKREGSTLELISIDPGTCDLSVPGTPCPDGILKLTLEITFLLPDGSEATPQTFVTTIIV